MCVVLEAPRACARTQVVVSILIRRQGSLARVGGRCRNYIWLARARTREENSEAACEVSNHSLINPPSIVVPFKLTERCSARSSEMGVSARKYPCGAH